jgi:hypothetical protein
VKKAKTNLLCPSAQPEMEDARVFALVAGTPQEPRVAYLKQNAVVTDEMVKGLEGLKPTQVFRYSARCEESRCAQYCEGRCSLGQRIADLLPAVTDSLPSCQIRPSCRWHAEIGAAACHRCPQVVTLVPAGQGELQKVAISR